jgi:hypothetical protein
MTKQAFVSQTFPRLTVYSEKNFRVPAEYTQEI